MEKHSQGGWRAVDGTVVDSGGVVIARMDGFDGIRKRRSVLVRGHEPVGIDFDELTRAEMASNARVMSEAPVLMRCSKALIAAVKDLEECGLGAHTNKKRRQSCYVRIDAAKWELMHAYMRIDG